MKTHIVLTLLVGVLFMYGCASKQTVRDVALPLEIKKTKHVSVIRARNYMDDESLIVSGAVKRDYFFRSAAYGHVDILFLDSENKIIEETNVRYLPVRVPSNRSSSLFKGTFDDVPKGTEEIVVSYHNNYFFDENHHSH